jgi:hypothetical protein
MVPLPWVPLPASELGWFTRQLLLPLGQYRINLA